MDLDLRLFGMMMVTFKMDLPPFLPASMAISGMVVEKGEDGEEETWPIVTSPNQTWSGLFSDCWP